MSAVSQSEFAELRDRVSRLERASVNNTETLKWVAGTLGTMKAEIDDHTVRLDRLEAKVDGLSSKVDGLSFKVDRLQAGMDSLPRVIAETVIELMKGRQS